MKVRAFATVLAFAATTLAPSGAAPSHARAGVDSSLGALDIIELEIAYTTILARYYEPVKPRELVDGARNGVAAELRARGIEDAKLPLTPRDVDRYAGTDLIDGLVLRSLARYGSKLDGHALVTAAVEGELGILRDPYTVLFRPKAFKTFNAFLGNGSFGGIGAVVSLDSSTGRAPVERALPDSPAAKAGLDTGDAIVSIDGRPVAGFANAQALLGALRGRIGTPVALGIVKADGSREDLTLTRASVRDPEVETATFGDAAYVRLTRFGDKAGEEVASAFAASRKRGTHLCVLDLRDNGGGYGDEAVNVASIFLNPGETVFTTLERGSKPVVSVAKREAGRPCAAAIVLVDGDTASASEIVAGALQDTKNGVVVGTKTFGKGVVQSVFALPDGSAVKMTTARYTTPNGRDIDHVGITPDHVVAEPSGSRLGDPATDPQLAAALALPRPCFTCMVFPMPTPTPSPSPTPSATP